MNKILKSVSSLVVSSVDLERKMQNGILQNKVSVNLSMTLDRAEGILDTLSIRLFVSTDKESSMMYDFVSQRYNEFLSRKTNDISSSELNKFLRGTINSSIFSTEKYLNSSRPFSPYCTDTESRNLSFEDRFSKDSEKGQISRGVMIYDTNLGELVEGENKDRKISLGPIRFPEFNTNQEIEQLSVYVFVYDNRLASLFKESPQNNFAINTRMSLVDSKVVLGTKTEYTETTTASPLVGMSVENSLFSPDKNLFTTIETQPENKSSETYEEISSRSKKLFTSYNISKEQQTKNVIKNRNYFSNLWLSRDQKDNHRFVFAFDLRSYLKDNGIFPFVYRNDNLSRMVIAGGDPSSPDQLSSVRSIDGYRLGVKRHGYISENELGTVGHVSEHHNSLNKRVSTGQIKRVLLETTQQPLDQGVQFFNGSDLFGTDDTTYTEVQGSYRYEVNCVVLDNSPQLLLNLYNMMLKAYAETEFIYTSLTNVYSRDRSKTYNSSTGLLERDIKNITLQIDGNSVSAYAELIKNVKIYEDFINSLEDKTDNKISSYYDSVFSSSQGRIHTDVIVDLMKLISSSISFLENTIESTLGSIEHIENQNKGKNKFEYNANHSIRKNTLFVSHAFQEVYDKRSSTGSGYDYIFDRDKNTDLLNNLSLEEFQVRTNLEFNKYFSGGKGSAELVAAGSYRDPSYAYMTPKIIKLPNKMSVDQTSLVDLDSTAIDFNFDDYGQLFSDIVTVNSDLKKSGLLPPVSDARGKDQSKNNKIYSSLMNNLSQDYSVNISETVSQQFSAPKVSKGFNNNTVYSVRERVRCSNEEGLPLISSIIGVSETQSATSKEYIDGVNTKIKNENTSRKKGDTDLAQRAMDKKKRSVSIPFLILGKLVLEDNSSFTADIQQESYNSLVELSNIFNISEVEIGAALESSPIRDMPNQIKSFLVFSTTNNVSTLGSSDGVSGFDVRRPKILGKANDEEVEGSISISDNKKGVPPYPTIIDPMKSYAKFLTFWLNYRQIAVIEYLSGFGSLRESDLVNNQGQRVKLPEWQTVNSSILERIEQSNNSILCRVRSLSSQDYINLVKDQISNDQLGQVIKFFQTKDLLNLPTYNEYFYIHGGNENQLNTNQYNVRTQD